jgi:hypothetical protein
VTDIRPTIDVAMDAFSLGATVTPPGGPAVEVRAFWLPSRPAEVPNGSEIRRVEPQRVLVLPLVGLLDGLAVTLPAVPRGTIVSIPEFLGADVADWKVDSAERLDFDHFRAIVVPVEATP